jgi:cell division septum initiation protein DivIVA
MSKKIENEKKAAIKILNKYFLKLKFSYADKYILLLEENKNLHQEIKDLKSNLKINKDIMSSFYTNSAGSKEIIIKKLKEENSNLYDILEKTAKERDLLRKKVNNYLTIKKDIKIRRRYRIINRKNKKRK